MSLPHILIVDDDSHIRQVIRFALEKEGYSVSEAEDGNSAMDRFRDVNPDLIVLDIMMPETDGTEVCKTIRRTSQTPIVFLSSKDEEIDRIVGLELGGDDYMTKPFSPRELVARVRAVLRRSSVPQNQNGERRMLSHGRLHLDPLQYKVHWDRREIVLTVTEFGLLKALLTQPGNVYSREQLMSSAYDYNNIVSDRTIDSHMRRLRAKLKNAGAAEAIETVHGVGYKLGVC